MHCHYRCRINQKHIILLSYNTFWNIALMFLQKACGWGKWWIKCWKELELHIQENFQYGNELFTGQVKMTSSFLFIFYDKLCMPFHTVVWFYIKLLLNVVWRHAWNPITLNYFKRHTVHTSFLNSVMGSYLTNAVEKEH